MENTLKANSIEEHVIKESQIKRVTAIYAGGSIYCYYAELENHNWIMGCDEWLIVVNSNPLSTEWLHDDVYDSDYPEWQQEHLVNCIEGKDLNNTLVLILNQILAGNTIQEYDDFSIVDIEILKEKLN